MLGVVAQEYEAFALGTQELADPGHPQLLGLLKRLHFVVAQQDHAAHGDQPQQ